MKSVGLLVTAIAVTLGYTQPPDTLWTKTYGGTGQEGGYSVAQTTDGGYVIAGSTYSYGAGSQDAWLIKTDASGDTLWTKTYGGAGFDWGLSVAQTTDGGYIITGITDSYGAGLTDVWLIKTDASGDTLWTKTYGGPEYDVGYSVAQTTDGGYIITGLTYSYGAGSQDVWLIKTDASGDTLWTKTYGGAGHEEGYSVAQTTDGGYVITGITDSYGAGLNDVWLIKTDASGDTLWTKTYGGADREFSLFGAQTTDGGYIITGYTSYSGGSIIDILLIKTDASGDTLWTKTYGTDYDDRGYSVAQTTGGGYVITGGTYSYGGASRDVVLIKTDPMGDTLWTRSYGGPEYDIGYSVAQTTDGGYIIAGRTGSYGAGSLDVWLIKTEPEVGVEENEPSGIVNKGITASIFRGPLILLEGKRCRIFDITGRVVEPDRIEPGIYFIEVNGVVTQKVVKVR